MATKNLQKEEKLTTEQKLIGSVSNFFVKNRLILIIVAAVVIVGIVAAILAVNLTNKAKMNAQIKVAELEQRYTDLLVEDNPDWASLISDLNATVKGSSYPSVKAAYLVGLAYAEQGDYATAQTAFEKAYNLNTKIYLAPLALVNMAACAEEQGNTAKALEVYNQIYNDYPESGAAPKALFNAARIYYQQGNTQLAQATFAQVASYYPNSEYGKLALNLANVL